MAQEFTINSSAIESKINQLLPSQGGFGAGVDFSASTMVIPIVDLTESAEGSGLRQDLQTAFNYESTHFSISGTTRTLIVNTTGYWRFLGHITSQASQVTNVCNLEIYDGTTYKLLLTSNNEQLATSAGFSHAYDFDFIVYLKAGESVVGSTLNSALRVSGLIRQIADINGNLITP